MSITKSPQGTFSRCGIIVECSGIYYLVDAYVQNNMSEDEEDMLDEAENLTDTSRLACQCRITQNLVVRIPPRESIWDDDEF